MVKKRNGIRVNPLAERIVKSALKVVFKKLFNIKPNMPEEIHNMKPPFVLLPTHQGFWDPFLAGVYFKPPVFYITSDAVFRSPIFGFLLKFLGAIPKTKARSDLDALKNIFEIKDQGKSIGIFPEGQRTWDGKTLPLIQSTSKLIRMLKIPVIAVVFKGGYYSQPRWGTSIRRGELIIDYKVLFTGEEVSKMKASEIHSRITEALSHDEIEYQKQRKIVFTGGRYAENIEQFLFACPSCGELEGFHSNKDRFTCLSCNKGWRINSIQEIEAEDGELHFDNVRDWGNWQLEKLRELIDLYFGTEKVLFEDDGIVFHTGFRSRKLRFLSNGCMRLTPTNITMLNGNGKVLKTIPLRNLSGLNVQNKEVLDFYFENVLYTVRDRNNHFSSFKWLTAVDYLQREKLRMNLPD
ncbi:MAG: 1-acyl-sn-glycerol-3-phosphate acyltransferase [Spirochaetales bacterium]|nr:1-acyl-sn-glycerol-3-phosphate acyltransferase [Spirochaetales bacterium]